MPQAKEISQEAILAHANVQQRTKERHRTVFVADDVWWCLQVRTRQLDHDCTDQLVDEILRCWCHQNIPEIVRLREQYDALDEQQRELYKQALKAVPARQAALEAASRLGASDARHDKAVLKAKEGQE